LSQRAETSSDKETLSETFAVIFIHEGHLQNILVLGLTIAISSFFVQEDEMKLKTRAAARLPILKEILNFFIAANLQIRMTFRKRK
jgi:hypothetical protein